MRGEDLGAILKALSTPKKMEIIRLLYSGPMSVEEISEKVSLSPWTTRQYLKELELIGFIQHIEVKGGVGRPKFVYKIAPDAPLIMLPPRNYIELATAMMEFILDYFGERANKIFEMIGARSAKKLVESLAKQGLKKMDVKDFKEKVVDQFLKSNVGGVEIVKYDEKRLIYRFYTCPYYELASKFPEIVCEFMEAGFRGELSKMFKEGIRYERRACIAHGDPYCEFIIEKHSEDKS